MKEILELLAFMCVVYTFIYWGFWWGLVSLLIPYLFPAIDLLKFLFG